MNFTTVDKLAIAAVLLSGILFIFDAMPKLTALIYSMVV